MLTLRALIPVVSWISLNAATGVLLTVPNRLRLYCFPVILIPAVMSFRTIHYLNYPPGLSEFWGHITLFGFIHFSSLLYVKKWTLRTTQLGRNVAGRRKIYPSRIFWTRMYQVSVNPRFVRVPYGKIILPEQGKQVRSTAKHAKFSKKKIFWLLVKISLLSLLNRLAISKLLRSFNVDDFAAPKNVLIRRLLGLSIYRSIGHVSTREILTRAWFAIMSIWTSVLLFDSVHTTLAVSFIYLLRVDAPADWPDLFGSPLEAFTLTRFWTRFWHRLVLSGYSDFANLFLAILPSFLTRNVKTRKVMMTFLLFLMSGLVHNLTSWQLNSSCRDYADLQFFCLNALGVIFESFLAQLSTSSRLFRQERHETGRSSVLQSLRAAVARLLGYVWVTTFFVWAVPGLYFQRLHCIIIQK